jgi:hypothetical protein
MSKKTKVVNPLYTKKSGLTIPRSGRFQNSYQYDINELRVTRSFSNLHLILECRRKLKSYVRSAYVHTSLSNVQGIRVCLNKIKHIK